MYLSRSSSSRHTCLYARAACWSSVSTALGRRPSKPRRRRSSTVKAVPRLVNGSAMTWGFAGKRSSFPGPRSRVRLTVTSSLVWLPVFSHQMPSSLPLRSPTTVLRTLREDALDDARQACGGVAVAAHGEEQADAGQRVATYCTASATSRRRVELPTRTHSSASPLPLGPLRYTGRVDGGIVTRHTSWRS